MPRVNAFNDPEAFASGLKTPDESKLILGLDLGTNCGMAYGYYRQGKKFDIFPWQMGQWDLSAGQYDSGAIRFVRLRHFLILTRPALVCYENVRFTPAESITRFSAAAIISRAATASELIGAFRATVATWCEENAIPCAGFGIGEIKKRATGHGKANKEDMVKACNQLFGTDFDPLTYENTGADNVADAAFVCLLAQEQYASGLAAA
jgi:hypothetical protein